MGSDADRPPTLNSVPFLLTGRLNEMDRVAEAERESVELVELVLDRFTGRPSR